MISIENISLNFSTKTIFNDTCFSLPDTGFVALMGESGTGKTTLIKIITEQMELSSATIHKNIDLNDIVYVDQLTTLNEDMTIKQHFEYIQNCYNKKENIECLEKYMNSVGLAYLSDATYIKNLSVGEKKRISIAFALSVDAKMIILDEPTASLDYENKESLLNLLKNLSSNKCIFIATHETDYNELFDMIYEIREHKINLIKGKYQIIDDQSASYLSEPCRKKIKIIKSKKEKRNNFLFLIVFLIIFNLITYQGILVAYEYMNANRISGNFSKNVIYLSFEYANRDDLPDSYSFSEYKSDIPVDHDKTIQYISSLDHVTSIHPYYQFCSTCYVTRFDDVNSSSSSGSVKFSNGKTLKINYTDEQGPSIVTYYDEENIINDNKKIKGNYISEECAQSLGINNKDTFPLTLTLDYGIPVCSLHRNDRQIYYDGNTPQDISYDIELYEDLYDKKQITLKIDGILPDNVYANYFEYNSYGDIYVNYDKITDILKENASNELRNSINLWDDLDEEAVSLHPTTYAITSDSVDQLDKIVKEIEKYDSKAVTYIPYTYYKDVLNALKSTTANSIYLLVIYSIIGLIAIIILLWRFWSMQNKQKVILINYMLKNKEINRILMKDLIKIMAVFIVLNSIILYIRCFMSSSEIGNTNNNKFFLILIMLNMLISLIVLIGQWLYLSRKQKQL